MAGIPQGHLDAEPGTWSDIRGPDLDDPERRVDLPGRPAWLAFVTPGEADDVKLVQ